MAVSGVGGSGTSIYGSRNVLSGLASGMDTESMIENMTKATRIKIAQQKQKKTLLGWKQQAYRGISTQLIDFSKKYMDYSSPTNLLSSAFFNQSITTSVGKNNGFISATGNTKSKVEINGVKQLAEHGSHVVKGTLGTQALTSKEFNVAADIEHPKLAGETLTFQFGTDKYTIKLDPEASLNNLGDVVNEINRQLGDTKVANGGTLKDKIQVSLDGNKIKFKSTDQAGNDVKLVEVGQGVKDVFKLTDEKLKDGIDLSKDGFTTEAIERKDLVSTQKVIDSLVDKTLTLSFNGQKKEITLMTEKEKEEISKAGDADAQNKKFIELLQGKLDTAFGSGNITLEQNPATGGKGGKIVFKVAGDDPSDPSKSTNVLKVVSASNGVLGTDGLFGFKTGDGNRLNMETSLKDLGIQFTEKDPDDANKKKPRDLVINGVTIGSFGEDSTIGDVIRAINANEKAGVNATYSEATNQFLLTTKETGENNKIDIKDGLAKDLFGVVDGTQVHGKDAIVDVTVNGAHKQFKRPSNEIDIDGLKVTVSGTFGDYSNGGNITVKPDETVTFTSKPDTEKVFDAIKQMVEDYNKIVDSVYKEMTTKPDREYQPLTDEQKAEMSKEQIEKWEEKAKEGLLFADTQLRSLHDSLRFIFNPGGEAGKALREMGIEPASDYKDGGKIKLDETKLKNALESDPEKVMNAFSALPSGTSDPNAGIMNSASKGGALQQLKVVTDRFASTSLVTPGILVARAGTPASPNSMLKNALQAEMDGIDNILKGLDNRLKKEVDRYNSQFTRLEMLISQMNAQSGQLAGLMGGGMM